MTDMSAIRVIPFYGKGDEWPTWSESFLPRPNVAVLRIYYSEYELQVAIMERRVGDAEKPLTIEVIREELSLRLKG